MKRIYCAVTIDTEPDSGPGWAVRTPYTFKSVTLGVKKELRPLFENLGVKPVYFISPAVAASDECLPVLKAELAGGAEIGAHLHADESAHGDPDIKGFSCYDYSDGVERSCIAELDALIKKNYGVKPVSFRAGRFGADMNTIRSLSELGYKVDSSVTPGIDWGPYGGPDFRGYARAPYFVDLAGKDMKSISSSHDLLEVPVTVCGKRAFILPSKWYFYRWLRPTLMTLWEMKRLVDGVIRAGGDKCDPAVFCMMFHSQETVPGISPYVRNQAAKQAFMNRLAGILKYVKGAGAKFATLSDIYRVMR